MNLGVQPSKTDLRDYTLAVEPVEVEKFKLENLPKIKDQYFINSCAAHSASSVLEWLNQKETGEYRELSTGFIYGMQGVEFDRFDTHMYLRDACKIMLKYGDCLQETVPFNVEMPECYRRLAEMLNDDIYNEAAICKIKAYAKCMNDNDVKYALMNYGPVIMAIKWSEQYEVFNNGVIHFDPEAKYGYHAVMAYGFNEVGWLCQNSFGSDWGKGGRFILPYNYGFVEAWTFVDDKNSGVHKPKRGKAMDAVYKVLNYIVNVIKELTNRVQN